MRSRRRRPTRSTRTLPRRIVLIARAREDAQVRQPERGRHPQQRAHRGRAVGRGGVAPQAAQRGRRAEQDPAADRRRRSRRHPASRPRTAIAGSAPSRLAATIRTGRRKSPPARRMPSRPGDDHGERARRADRDQRDPGVRRHGERDGAAADERCGGARERQAGDPGLEHGSRQDRAQRRRVRQRGDRRLREPEVRHGLDGHERAEGDGADRELGPRKHGGEPDVQHEAEPRLGHEIRVSPACRLGDASVGELSQRASRSEARAYVQSPPSVRPSAHTTGYAASATAENAVRQRAPNGQRPKTANCRLIGRPTIDVQRRSPACSRSPPRARPRSARGR